GSPIRDRALLIQTLLAVQPENAALPDLVQRLADSGVRREWASTHDTALAVLAIGRYLRESKRHEPYDTAQLALGEQVLASASEGGSIGWNAPPGFDASSAPLLVKIAGADNATAHVSWLKTGVPLTPPADAEHGMKVRRRYLAINGDELRGSVRSGDLVRVELTLQAPPQQAGIVIEDMLPAGLEVENPRLETSAKDRAKDDRPTDVPGFDDNRLDVMDDRVVIVGSMPSAWKAKCTYLARAVTPGVYVVPPVRAEQMYDINVNALSGAGATLTVTSATSNIASVHDDAAP
ncbi:MAG TPA: hypothetical protein VLI90_06830, partial [Tepidisphaeraceae bacterium]|nr:hypothetical protein [Tepidisphaeraceae bacterium]